MSIIRALTGMFQNKYKSPVTLGKGMNNADALQHAMTDRSRALKARLENYRRSKRRMLHGGIPNDETLN